MRPSEEPLLTEGQIALRVSELAAAIARDYQGRDLVLIILLNGAFVFAADLVRRLRVPASLAFIRAKSYAGTESNGPVCFSLMPELPLADKDVLVVDDILDTGRTTAAVLERLASLGPASVSLCTLLDKPSRRIVPVSGAYVGFTIEDHFVVGYGLDYEERFRELPAVHCLVPG